MKVQTTRTCRTQQKHYYRESSQLFRLSLKIKRKSSNQNITSQLQKLEQKIESPNKYKAGDDKKNRAEINGSKNKQALKSGPGTKKE